MSTDKNHPSPKGSSDAIGERIRQIRGTVSECSTESVVGWCMAKHALGVFSKPDLTSPAKQIHFLLGVLVESSEPSGAREFDADDWRSIIEPLESLFSAYLESYYPDERPLRKPSEQWFQLRAATSTAYATYFNQSLLASVEQIADRIRTYITPYDDQLAADFGISATDALAIADWISQELQQMLDQIQQGHTEYTLQLGKIYYSELIRRFELKGASFWQLFTVARGQGQQLHYPTELSIAEVRPLIRLSADVAMCFSVNALFISILERCEKFLSTSAQKQRYFRFRDKKIEDQTASAFINIFGAEAAIYRNVFETPDNQYEHDLVIVAKNLCLFVEAKASPPHEVFRDPDKAFKRLRREFRSDSGIQKAYNQTLRLLRAIRAKDELVLYDKSGNEALRLSSSIADIVFCVCVTRDNYGPLATYLPWLLEKEHDDPFPWVVNILDLENIAEAWKYFGWNERQLKAYISQRIKFHSQLFSADELDYTGAFVKHCGLQHLIHGEAFVQLAPNYSDVFDNIHAHIHYGGPVVNIMPVFPASADMQESYEAGQAVFVQGLPEGPISAGRNERCPCESGVKFKRCHGE